MKCFIIPNPAKFYFLRQNDDNECLKGGYIW